MGSKLYLTVLFVVTVFLVQGTKLSAEEENIHELAVCGKLREPIAFWLWQRMAGHPDKTRVSHIQNIQSIEFKTRDGIILGGYKLAASVPRGYILVAQGNAMLVDQVAADFEVFRKAIGIAAIIFILALLGACSGTYYKTLEGLGIEKRDILVDRVEDARDAQDSASEQFTSALDQFRSTVNFDGGDLEKIYDRLNKAEQYRK